MYRALGVRFSGEAGSQPRARVIVVRNTIAGNTATVIRKVTDIDFGNDAMEVDLGPFVGLETDHPEGITTLVVEYDDETVEQLAQLAWITRHPVPSAPTFPSRGRRSLCLEARSTNCSVALNSREVW